MGSNIEIRAATADDIVDIAHINILAYNQNPLWKHMHIDVEPSELRGYILRSLQFKFAQPEYRYVVAVEKSTL